MYRNNNICTIDLAVNTSDIEDFLLQKYMKGAQIVFVTQKNILLGGVTKGDIYRLLRKSNNDSHIIQLINKNIKRITFINEKQVFEDAEKIFNINKKIHNIPVVNKSGELLFEIDRFSENMIISKEIEDILNAAKFGAIKSFLESDNIKEIIIIGSCKKTLCQAEQIFYKYCGDLISEKNIKITIKDNIKELHIDDTNIKIVSLNKIGVIYLNKISKFNYDVISSGELYSFAEFKKIKNFSKDIISNFIEVFKYKRIDICLLNRYTSFFIELINSCNIECSYIERSTRYKDYFENNDTSIFDVFLFSDSESGGGYCEKENVINLINYIELLQKYKQITGSYLTHNKYITECVDYLYKLKNKGFDGFLQETKSYWQNEFHKKIEEKGNLEVINSLENTNSGKRYIDAYQNIYKVPDKNFYVSIKFFLMYICEHAVHKVLIEKCKNVFVFSTMFNINNDIKIERNRDNYLKDTDSFENNFINDICNNDKNYLKEVIKNRENCEIIILNNGYIKFLSNYHSKYFNTDLYGNRIVSYNPTEYLGTIWLIGNCLFNGYAVEDKHTFASFLQKKINSAGYKYILIQLYIRNKIC